MRIVIDLQGAQGEAQFHGIGRYSLDSSLAIARNPRDHEIWLLVNGAFVESARLLRQAFAPWVRADRILTFSPPSPLEWDGDANRPRRDAAERIRAHLLRSVEPDCVILTSLVYPLATDAVTSNGTASGAAPDLDARTAMIVYDLIPWLRPETYLSGPVATTFYEGKLVDMRAAGLLLAISDSSRQEALEFLDAPPERVVAISSAAGDAFSPGTPDPAHDPRPALGITRPFLMHAPSGIDPRKNNEGLIKAFARLPAELRAGYQLVLTSKFAPHDQERLRILARREGLGADALVLTGFVSDTDLVALYRSTDLFVYPSTHEGFGLPVLEAMSCGAPVIGSDRTSIPEIIDLPEALFDPTSVEAISTKIADVLADDELRDTLRAHGPVRAKEFSWDRTASKALDAIEATYGSGTPVQAAGRDRLLHELLDVVPSRHAGHLPDIAQAVAESAPPSQADRQVLVDTSGLTDWPGDAGVYGAGTVFVDAQETSRGQRFVLRQEPPALADQHPGDALVVANAANLTDPGLRAVYERAQAFGAQLAVPLASTTQLVDALGLLGPADLGLFCADNQTFEVATRAAANRGVEVHRVEGVDVRDATVRHVLATGR